MAKLKSVPLKQRKGKQEPAVNSIVLDHKHLRAATEHMNKMWEPVYQLIGLLDVLRYLDPKQDGPGIDALVQTFSVLSDLAEAVKAHHDGFWDNYDLSTGQALEKTDSEEGG